MSKAKTSKADSRTFLHIKLTNGECLRKTVIAKGDPKDITWENYFEHDRWVNKDAAEAFMSEATDRGYFMHANGLYPVFSIFSIELETQKIEDDDDDLDDDEDYEHARPSRKKNC